MKVISLTATTIALLLSATTFAQKYKVKDDVISQDKLPIGKISGDAGVDKTNMTILDMNGSKVLTLTQGRFNPRNPFFNNITWYNVKFEDTGKEMKIYHAGNCGPKCVINNALVPAGITLDGGMVKDQDAIIEKKDISQKINNDTTSIVEKHSLWTKHLQKNSIIRDGEKPVMVTKATEETTGPQTVTTYLISQDNVVIGKIIKEHTQTSTSIVTKYDLFETLYRPEDGLTEVPAAKVIDTFMDIAMVTVIDGKEHHIKFDNTANAQGVLAEFLVKKGYL